MATFFDDLLITDNGIPSPPVPQVSSAVALTPTSVRITFSEPMTDNAAIRTTLNYTFSGLGVLVSASLITPEAITFPTYVDVSLNNELTSGPTYTVIVTAGTGILSDVGTPISATFNQGSFAGIGVSPFVSGASSLSISSVRIVFNEDMLPNAALSTLSNYSFTGGLVATGVLFIGANYIDLSTTPQIFAFPYTATVTSGTGIQDDSFNPITIPLSVGFLGNSTAPLPTVLSAAPTISTLVVTFSLPMSNNSALSDKTNYVITSLSFGASNVSVTNVTPEAVALPTFVTLTISEQTIGSTYEVEANNILSSAGAPIDTSLNTDTFIGIGDQPRLLGAAPINTNTVRLTFSEPIRLASGFNNPLSYTINGGLTIAAAISQPASAQPYYVDLVFTTEMISGFLYTTTASLSLTDLASNTLDFFFSSTTFLGQGIQPFPQVAEFINANTIEVKFNESLFNDSFLISPLSYTLNNGGVVSAVTVVSSSIIRLSTSGTLFNILYILTVSTSITDLGGNSIDFLRSSIPVTKLQLFNIGAIDGYETLPLNVLDGYNDGYAVEICEFSNGLVSLQVGGSSPDGYSIFESYSAKDGYTIEGYYCVGTPYDAYCGTYEFDYDTYINTNFDLLPDRLYIGSDFQGNFSADAIIDDLRISNNMLLDTRIGETLPTGQESVTLNANRIVAFKDFLSNLNNTLVLIDFDGGVFNLAPFIKFFTQGFFAASGSVNENFLTALRFITPKGFQKSNTGIFNPNEGAIEFWIRPLIDTNTDENIRYYFDIKSSISGNRMSIYKSPDGRIVWEIIDDNGDRIFISCRVNWKKCDWHRIAVSWDFNNSVSSTDFMHMVVDNQEVGGVRYGTTFANGDPILYGDGITYGACADDVGTTRGISDANIDFTEGKISPDGLGFPRLIIGSNDDDTSEPGHIIAMADIDNVRISNASRTVSVLASGFGSGPASSLTIPVIEDNFTTFIDNFDELLPEQTQGAILIDRASGVFSFTVEVLDNFDKVIADPECTKLITDLLNVIKPAHTTVQVLFKE